MSKLVKAREDPTVVLELADEAFHQMPLTIPVAVILPWLFRALMRRDHRFCSTPNYHLNQRLARIPSIGDDALEGQSLHQRWGVWAVMALASTQMDAQRIAQAIDQKMQLGAEASSTSSQRLLMLRAVFFFRQGNRDVQEAASAQRSSSRCRNIARL